MKKIFFLLMVFCSIKAISQDTLYIDINGRFYDLTINKKSTNFYIGGGNAYNDQVYIYANTKDTFTIYINCANCTWNLGAYKLKANLIYINGTKTTSITNLKNILGTIFTASNSGGGGGGSYTFAGNIVSQIGNDIIINQLQTDWNAISGLGSIANKPNIPILDSTQFVKLRDSNKNNNGFITPSFFFNNRGSGTKWSNFILGGYLVQKLNDSTYTITRDNTTIQDSIRINATIARFTGDSVKRDTSIANRVIDMSVDTNTNRLTIYKTNSNNKVLQLKINGGGGGGTATNYPLATMDSIGVIKTGKYIRNNTNYNFSQSNITTPTIKVDYVNGLFLRGSSYNGDANLWTSTDGVNWTSRASGATSARFLYYKGKYFAQRYTSVGNLYSTDGVTWTNTNNNGGNAQIVNDTLFTFSYLFNQSAYSTDGTTFTRTDQNMQGFGDDFVYNGKGVFVATTYGSGQLTPKYFIRGGEWTQINGVDGGTVCRAAFYSTTKKMFILGHYFTNNSYSYYSYDGINYSKCIGMGGDGSQIVNIREINGVIFACGGSGIFYSYDGINFFKTNLIIPVSDITYNAGVLYSSNTDGTSISYSYDGIFWFTNNYSGIGVIESIAGNGSNRVVIGTSTGVFYNSSLKTDSTLIANITKGLYYDSLGNINIDSNYIKYLIRNNTSSGGGGGGTTDTTSLSNRINAKLDVARFVTDSVRWDSAINKNILKVATDSNIGGIKVKDCSNFTISKDSTYIENISNDTSIYLVRKVIIDTILKNEFLMTTAGLYYNRNRITTELTIDGDYNTKNKKLYFPVGDDFSFKGLFSFDVTNNKITKELDKSMINNDTLIIALQFINDSILLFVDLKKGLWQYNINSKQVSILSIYPRTLGNNIIYSWIKNRNDIYLIPTTGGIVVKNGQPLYKGTQTEMLNKNITNDYIFIIDSTGIVNVYDSNGNFLKKSNIGYSSVWYIVKYNKDNYILSTSSGIYQYNISSNNINTIVDTPNIYGRPRGIYVENTCIILGKQKVGRYSYYSPLSSIYFNAVGSLNFKTKFPFYRTYDGYFSIRNASKLVDGVVKIGNNINVDTFGTISVNLPFLDTTRFTSDSIRWDTAIANRIITQRIDTNFKPNLLYKKQTAKLIVCN